MPTPTDLVTDLPADFEVFGQAVATSLADLLGGTSGQILAKNSNTDMDFVWIANDQGDITGITASSPLTGGGTSGAVTVGIQDATTAQKGAVQLENSTSSTSTTTAAVPANVKSAYDLADGAIAKTTLTTAGDVLYRNATVPVRLGIGTAGQVLTVNSGATAPEWATPAAGSTFAGCAVYKVTTSQSLANDTDTDVSFNAEDFDTDGYHDNSTNNTRITIPAGKAGKYLLQTAIAFASNSTGVRSVGFRKNATSKLGDIIAPALSGFAQRVQHLYVADLAEGDYVTVEVNQNSGGSLNAIADQVYTRFSAIYLGA
jgi:hypothetical protein